LNNDVFRVLPAVYEEWERAYVIAARARVGVRRAVYALFDLEKNELVERRAATEGEGELARNVYYWRLKEK